MMHGIQNGNDTNSTLTMKNIKRSDFETDGTNQSIKQVGNICQH